MQIHVIYEGGVLRPLEPVGLTEGQEIEIILLGKPKSRNQKYLVNIITHIASLPIEGDGSIFSGRDHDNILYLKP